MSPNLLNYGPLLSLSSLSIHLLGQHNLAKFKQLKRTETNLLDLNCEMLVAQVEYRRQQISNSPSINVPTAIISTYEAYFCYTILPSEWVFWVEFRNNMFHCMSMVWDCSAALIANEMANLYSTLPKSVRIVGDYSCNAFHFTVHTVIRPWQLQLKRLKS